MQSVEYVHFHWCPRTEVRLIPGFQQALGQCHWCGSVCKAKIVFSPLQKGVASELRAKEKERVGHYRETTKAALVIQLAWRKYRRRKRYREALEQQAKAMKVREGLVKGHINGKPFRDVGAWVKDSSTIH